MVRLISPYGSFSFALLWSTCRLLLLIRQGDVDAIPSRYPRLPQDSLPSAFERKHYEGNQSVCILFSFVFFVVSYIILLFLSARTSSLYAFSQVNCVLWSFDSSSERGIVYAMCGLPGFFLLVV